jgi:uroporphyrinogen decarboxylase
LQKGKVFFCANSLLQMRGKIMLSMRERVYASIRRQGMDAIPWQFDLTSVVREKLEAYYGTDDLLSATGDHVVYTGMRYPVELLKAAPAGETRIDEFGAVWGSSPIDRMMGDWGMLLSSPLTEPALKGFSFPDPGNLSYDHITEARQKHPDHFLVACGEGIFERSWSLCGFENYLSYIAGEEVFVEELASKLADYSCEATKKLKGLGVDGIRFGDDLGFQSSLMIQPDVWRRIFKKHYKRIYQAGHDAGLIVMIHSCGNITEIIPDMIEIGVQVFNPLQPEAMDVRYCKKEFGNDIAFWGGLGSQSTIPNGTTEDVRREVKDRLELFSGGGYILAPAGAIPTETPVGNVVAIINEAKENLKRKCEGQKIFTEPGK